MAHIKQLVLSQKFQRRLGITAGVVLLIWLGSWLLLPRLIAQQVQDKATQALGRAVTVRSVDVSPWSLAVAVNGLEVAGLPGRQPALSVERAYINASFTSLLRWAPVLDALELDQPVVRVRKESDGSWDFEDVLSQLGQDPQPKAPDAGPMRMALYNIQIRDGRVELDDQLAGVQQTIESLQLQLPFISTLPSQREVKVLPQLSMQLNGSEIASQAVATPFDIGHSVQATLDIKQFDLAPYAAYLPASLPVRLHQGVVNAQIAVSFDQSEQDAVVQLQGSRLQLSDLKLQDAEGQPLAGWQQMQVDLGDTRPLQQHVHIAKVQLQKPFGLIHRRADGAILPLSAPPSVQDEVESEISEKVADNAGWKLLIDQFDVQDGWGSWQDDVGGVGANLYIDQLNLQSKDWAWPMTSEAQWQFSAQLQNHERAARGSVHSIGKGGLERGEAAVTVEKLDAQALHAYAKQWIKQPVGGLLSLQGNVTWQQGRMQAQVPMLSVGSVSLGQVKAPDVAWTGLQLQNLTLDTDSQKVEVEHIALESPSVRIQRNAQGRWMYEQWLSPVAGAPGKGREAVVSSATGKQWQVLVKDMSLAAGQVELMDASFGGRPLALKLSDVQLNMQNVDSTKGTAQAKFNARVAERARGGGWGRSGSVAYQGALQLDPLLAKGRVDISALPLQAFEAYLAPYLNVRLARALASFNGDVQYIQLAKGPQLKLQGQGRINDLHVKTLTGDAEAAQAVQGPQAVAARMEEDLLRWKQLRLQGIRVNLQPERVPYIQVRSTELQDFYARVVVLPEGRLNLQNLIKQHTQGEGPGVEVDVHSTEHATNGVEATAHIDMGPIALQGGVIKFSDYFIQPNYSADLTGLQGQLAAFSSQPLEPGEAPALAKLSLEGVAQGTAQLHIEGEINPLAEPLALNVRAQVKGLDLSPLTPYAIKYAGHGIEKGKLSMDVHYVVQPDGELTATNQLVLNQLTFTDPVEGAPASLPVRLAVALLADSNGVIDLNLPISGSLNDPQFSLAPVIFKIIGNIIRKAVTAPFSLLAGAFTSDDEQSGINFELGYASLNTDAQSHLQQLAKAMQGKPQLQLTLVGQVDRATEEQGWKRARLEQLVQGSEALEDGGDVSVRSEKQKMAALKKIYRDTVKDRQRNILGMTKDLPPQEMTALILKDMVMPANAWQELAAARAQNVRNYLLEQGVDSSRIFLGEASDKTPSSPSPSVLLNISVQ